MFMFLRGLCDKMRPCEESLPCGEEMADEIGFHAIWDERFHNVRPTTLASGSPDAASGRSCTERELCYAGIVPVGFRW